MKKIEIKTDELAKGIKFASNFIAKSPIVEITKELFLELKPDSKTLVIFGTNLNEGGFIEVEVEKIENIKENVKFTLPKKLSGILKTIEDGFVEVELKFKEDSVSETIFHTNKSTFKFQQYSSADEFPAMEKNIKADNIFSLNLEKLKQGLEETAFSISKKNENTPALENVYIDLNNDKVKLVATDTYRLSYVEFENSNYLEDSLNFFITPNIISVVEKFKGDAENIEIKLQYQDSEISKIFYEYKNKVIFNQNISDKFPNYNLVLDNGNPYETEIVIDVDKIKPQLKRIKGLLNIYEETDVIQLSVTENEISFIKRQGDSKFIDEKLEVDFEYKQDLNIHFSTDYLIDFVNNINEDKFKLQLENKLNPLMLKQTNEERKFEGLIMPVRAN